MRAIHSTPDCVSDIHCALRTKKQHFILKENSVPCFYSSLPLAEILKAREGEDRAKLPTNKAMRLNVNALRSEPQ